MKEYVKIGILFFLVVFFAVFFASTRGNDELNLNLDFDFSTQEEFSYPIYDSEYNGEYRNTKSNGAYVLVGKNADDTYRMYFIQTIRSIKNIVLQLDNAKVVNGKLSFEDANNSALTLEFGGSGVTIDAGLGSLGNEKIEGYYTKVKNLDVFSMSEFEF